MRLITTGKVVNPIGSILGKLTTIDINPADRAGRIRLVSAGTEPSDAELSGYRAVLFCEQANRRFSVPYMESLRDTDHFRDGDIVALDGRSGTVRSLYRPYEKHHHIFVTERCNSNCLMCSQPPKDRDDVDALTERNLELIELIDQPPSYLTITGGEPTLLGDHLFRLIQRLKEKMPNTELHMLTNGRTFAWPRYTQRFARLGHPNISLGIPLYSDNAGTHDYIVQARGAFDQTVAGLHQAARNGIRVEIRVVLHRLTLPRLAKLAEYIFRNFTFVEHIALMGLEYTGYTPRNIDELWVDPVEYQDELEQVVQSLANMNMNVSIYNHQLCTLKQTLWAYSRQSISDWKNLYLPECTGCAVKFECGGFFQWAVKKHSEHIHPLV